MTELPNPKLTDGQKDCLRLAGRLLTSKEIGRELRISPFTVDQRLDVAKRKLGVRTRKDAARVFAEMDEIHIYQPLVYEAPEVADHGIIEEQRGIEKVSAASMRQDVMMDDLPTSRAGRKGGEEKSHNSFSLSLPALGGKEHELEKLEIFAEVVKVAVFSVISMSAIVAMMVSVMKIISGMR